MPPEDVVAINGGVVELGNECDVWMPLLDLRYGPVPELHGHHVGHVAAEAVDALLRPEEQNVEHLVPGGGDGGEVALASGVIYAIVQFYRLIPVVLARIWVKTVVAGGHGGLLVVEIGALPQVDARGELLAGHVVEIVGWRESKVFIVAFSQVVNAVRLGDAVVLTRHMVWHEVDECLEACLVGALHQ